MKPATAVVEYRENAGASSQLAALVLPLSPRAETLRRIYSLAAFPPPWRLVGESVYLFFRAEVLRPLPLAEDLRLVPADGLWEGPPEFLPPLPDLTQPPPATVPKPRDLFDLLRSDLDLAEAVSARLGGERTEKGWMISLDGHFLALTPGLKETNRAPHFLVYDRNGKQWYPLEAALFFAAHGTWPKNAEEKSRARKMLLDLALDCGLLIRLQTEAYRENLATLRTLFTSIPPFWPALGKEKTSNLQKEKVLETINETTLPPRGGFVPLIVTKNPSQRRKELIFLEEVLLKVFSCLDERGLAGAPCAGASVRWLARELKAKPAEVCRAINFLVCLGLLRKMGRDVKPGAPDSKPEKFGLCQPGFEVALRRWGSLGLPRPRQISRFWLSHFWPEEEIRKVIRGAKRPETEAEDEDEEYVYF